MDRKANGKRLVLQAGAILLCTALLWAALLPIAASGNIRMDNDRMIRDPETALSQYITENRGGLVLLLRLFGLDRWHPVRSGVLYLLFLTLNGWLLCFLIRRLTGWKDEKLYLLFFLLYTVCPVWAYHAYFTLQLAPVGLGMLLCTGMAGTDSLLWSAKRKRPALRAAWEVFAVLLLGFCVTVYQALAVHFAAAWAALMFCFLRKTRKASLPDFMLPVIRVILAVAGALLVSGFLRGGAETAYLNSQILWGKVPFPENCWQIIRSAGATLILANSSRFTLYPAAAVCLFLLWYRRRKEKTGRPAFTLVSLALLILPFTFNLALGNATVPRTQFALQLTAALLPVCFLGDSEKQHRVFRTALVTVLVIQAALIARLYHTDNIRNEMDTEAAGRICAKLEDADPAVPVVFYGKLEIDDSSVLTEKTDVFGRSFFEWIYTEEKPDSATLSALRLLEACSGKKFTRSPSWDAGPEAFASLPCYPEDGFVQKTDEYILVKLSE